MASFDIFLTVDFFYSDRSASELLNRVGKWSRIQLEPWVRTRIRATNGHRSTTAL